MVHSLIHADLLSPRIKILLYVVMPMLVIHVALGVVGGARVDRAAVTAGTAALLIASLGVVRTAIAVAGKMLWLPVVLMGTGGRAVRLTVSTARVK